MGRFRALRIASLLVFCVLTLHVHIRLHLILLNLKAYFDAGNKEMFYAELVLLYSSSASREEHTDLHLQDQGQGASKPL